MTARSVFISHAHADNDLCEPYADALRQANLDVWYDRDNMQFSEPIPAVIGRELKKRTAMVIMLTPNAVASRWVSLEVSVYVNYWVKDPEKYMILPVMLLDCEPTPILAPFRYIDTLLRTQRDVMSELYRALGAEERTTVELPALGPADLADLRSNDPLHRPVGQMQAESLGKLSRFVDDWTAYMEEKWRAVNDSQLGWKPLRGRWDGWEAIYRDSFGADNSPSDFDPISRRFDNAQAKGSAALAVACFLRDLDQLRRFMFQVDSDERRKHLAAMARPGSSLGSSTGKGPIIRNPMIVDAD